MLIAITREVGSSLGNCELSFVDRAPIDAVKAQMQHDAYRRALRMCGCRVLSLPAEQSMPDAVFVEDVAVVLDEIAILTRPGAASRRGEGASVATVLATHRALRAIEAPGTLDGGDVLRVGRSLYVGESARSNAAGAAQLRALVTGCGYTVTTVPIRGCLHLKSAVTQVADNALLINPAWVPTDAFARYRLIEIDPAEAHAANALRIGEGDTGRLIYPVGFPRTQRRLERAGIALTAVEMSELQKAEGAATCCSLVFRA